MSSNPLLQQWQTPYGLPPFEAIRAEDFAPAFAEALRQHRQELDQIASDPHVPDFDNTVAAFDRSGALLSRLEALFYTLAASASSEPLQAVQREMAAPLAAHQSHVYMHAALFARLDAVHASRHASGLSPQQCRLVERVHLDFVRAGARLNASDQLRYAEIVKRQAELHTQFAQNVLADESGYQLVLRDEADMDGLPEFVRKVARQAARERGLDEGLGAVTLSRSHVVPFLTFSRRRDLRQQLWQAWVSRGEHPGATDNRALASELLALRLEQARLHGHASYADYALADTMAGRREAVMTLLEQVWTPALAAAGVEQEALLEAVSSSGDALGTLQAWDWRYYAEKVRQQRYALDEAELKPYLALPALVEALFDCARRLFGLHFVHQPGVVAYHPDVQVYEVHDAQGQMRGVFLHDNFARANKRSGAWMNALRWQSRNADGSVVLPIILNNNNFAKAAPGEVTLLGLDDARTLFHEFGHGLHGLLSDVDFERLSGTQVLRDFVELPSQLFEHWLQEPQVLKQHARHVQTGEPIPDALLARIKAAEHFNQGYETLRYTASALVDMAAHARSDEAVQDITQFEADTLAAYGLPPAVGMNHRLAHFQHLFSGSSYAAGYYVYLWAEVLDADAYGAFTEAGDPFDPAVAQRLLTCIYGAGNSLEPGAAFRAFRGRDPQVQPMLAGRGLLSTSAVPAGGPDH